MGVVENLERAKKQIEDPTNWTRFKVETPDGRHCAVGAFIPQRRRFAAWHPRLHWVARHRQMELQYLANAIPYGTRRDTWGAVSGYNDSHSHASVMRLFDRAIANARADEHFEMTTVLAREEDLAAAGD